MKQAKVTLEQWQAFKAVVDEGSFNKAAETLSKSQSSISYAISKLEEQLPSPVLVMEGRKAVLTEAGKVLYRRASQLLDLALTIEQTAQCLADGWETQLILDIDTIIPVDKVFQAIQEFAEVAPQTRLTILETTLSGTVETLLEKKADLVLTAQLPTGFIGPQVTTVTMIPVAHANHPLARAKKAITQQELQNHRQIVVRDSGTRRNLDAGWLGAEQRLTVSHFNHSLKALKAGLGFSFVPEHIVVDDLQNGNLKRLNVQDSNDRQLPIYLLKSVLDGEGPAVKAMSEILQRVFSTT